MHIGFNFNNETAVPSYVHWTGNDMEISGEFGEISFDNNELDNIPGTKYKAYRVGFKSNPEH